ncbi:hypothetical protein [Streptomyces sp. NPDC048277]|uniref:hypothetical protein n=1 Tax=Streptomyces sp. NPDC048277 TaxID=3155027 RepID=UPI0033D4F4F4
MRRPARATRKIGSTGDPASQAAWTWNGTPTAPVSGTSTTADQPRPLVNRHPSDASQDDLYVSYEDTTAPPTAQVFAEVLRQLVRVRLAGELHRDGHPRTRRRHQLQLCAGRHAEPAARNAHRHRPVQR